MSNPELTLEDLLAMADAIGGRTAHGNLPAQDDQGRYVFSDYDLDLLPQTQHALIVGKDES